MASFAKAGGLEAEGVHEGVGISEAQSLPAAEGPAPVDEAVVEGDALEAVGVHQQRGRKPAAEDMDVRRGAVGHAVVHDLHRVARDARGPIRALEYADVLVCARTCIHAPTLIHHAKTLSLRNTNKSQNKKEKKKENLNLFSQFSFK